MHNTTTQSRQKQKGKPAVFLQQLLSSQLTIHSSNTWASFTALCSIIQERWNKSSTYSKNVIALDEFKMFQGDLWIWTFDFIGCSKQAITEVSNYRNSAIKCAISSISWPILWCHKLGSTWSRLFFMRNFLKSKKSLFHLCILLHAVPSSLFGFTLSLWLLNHE